MQPRAAGVAVFAVALGPACDLDAYCERIGHAGPRAPTLATLRALHRRHPEAIAFENLDPLLGIPVDLEPGALWRKLVHGGRGGYCFEHNLLFARVLAALGFAVATLGARVVWQTAADAITPRTHLLLRVELADGPYLADVGFGGLTLSAPLRLEPGLIQATPHEPCRLTRRADEWLLEARLGERWQALYRFTLEPQQAIDHEVANWYVATHPRSRFVSQLLAARCAPGRRFALLDNALAIHHRDRLTERHVLRDDDALRAVLTDTFGLRLPCAGKAGARLDAVLARITARG